MTSTDALTLEQIEQIFQDLGLATEEQRARLVRLYPGWPTESREPATTLETTTGSLEDER
jgi:hypothetical protein